MSKDAGGPLGAGAPPLVSVIITCCNGAPWIAEAVDSALAQTYAPLEIIVIDDGSHDASQEILRRYRDTERVQLVFQPRNRGIPATKNAGVTRSRGRYVAFLEQDDVWLEHKLERQIALLETDAALGMVFAEALVAGPGGARYRLRRRAALPASTQATVVAFFLSNPVISMSSVVIRRAVLAELGGFDEGYMGGDDYELYLRLVGRHRVACVHEPLLQFRWGAHSFSWGAMEHMLRDQLATVDRAAALYPFLAPMRRRRVARIWLSAAMRSFEAGATARAFGWAWQAWRSDPSFVRALPHCLLLATGGLGRWLLHRRRWGLQFVRDA